MKSGNTKRLMLEYGALKKLLARSSFLLFFISSQAYATNFSLGSILNQVKEFIGYSGDGADGALSLPNATFSGEEGYPSAPHTINDTRAALSASASAGATSLSIGAITSGSFAVGNHILVIQMTGANAGEYEFAIVTGVAAGSLTLSTGLSNSYGASGSDKSQVIKVPRYTNVLLDSGAVLTSAAWDGTTGGVLAFKASGSVEVHDGGGNNHARISMGYETFTGGPGAVQGKGFAADDEGFDLGGVAGASSGKSITPGQHTRLIMGSGGAGGSGQRGGGIVIIKADSLNFGGSVGSNGSDGAVGGAGGTILLTMTNIGTSKTIGGAGSYSSCGTIAMNGGTGAEAGRAFVHYETNLNCLPSASPNSNNMTIRKFTSN